MKQDELTRGQNSKGPMKQGPVEKGQNGSGLSGIRHNWLRTNWEDLIRGQIKVHAVRYALLMYLLLAAPTSTHGVFTSFSLSQYCCLHL